MTDPNETMLRILETKVNMVEGKEQESIKYKIEKLKQILQGTESKCMITTAKVVSKENLDLKLNKENNLLQGYRRIKAAEHSLNDCMIKKIDFCKIKLLMYEKEYRSEENNILYNGKFEKTTGSVVFQIKSFEFDPIFEIESLHFYIDLKLKLIVSIQNINEFEVTFEDSSELEIFLFGKNEIILGTILLPCEFFTEKNDIIVEMDFRNFNYIKFKINFKQEIGLIRKNAIITCVYKNGHGLESLPTFTPKICGVCTNFITIFSSHYKCFRCLFTCHKKCIGLILFFCKNSTITVKTEEFKIQYDIPHKLIEVELGSFYYCNHCGENINSKKALLCTECEVKFHIDCEKYIFNSCKMYIELRKKMAEFKPKHFKLDISEQTIKIEDFKIIKTIGKGSFGKIFLTKYKDYDFVALKVVQKKNLQFVYDLKYLNTERKVLNLNKQFNHPFLNHLFFCFQDDTRFYFGLEYLPSGDLLYQVVHGKLTCEQIKIYACEILLGIEFLHNQNIIYRDLKLDNILLGNDGHIKICDFGLCKEFIETNMRTHTFCGTPDTMAPEIIKCEGYTNSVDWWSYGIVLYEMYTKSPPFLGSTNREIYENITHSEPIYPSSLSYESVDLIKKLLLKNPEARLGSGENGIKNIKDHFYFKDVKWDDIYNKKGGNIIILPMKYENNIFDEVDSFNCLQKDDKVDDYFVNFQ